MQLSICGGYGGTRNPVGKQALGLAAALDRQDTAASLCGLLGTTSNFIWASFTGSCWTVPTVTVAAVASGLLVSSIGSPPLPLSVVSPSPSPSVF